MSKGWSWSQWGGRRHASAMVAVKDSRKGQGAASGYTRKDWNAKSRRNAKATGVASRPGLAIRRQVQRGWLERVPSGKTSIQPAKDR